MSSIGFSSFRLSSMTVRSSSQSLVWYRKVTCITVHHKQNIRPHLPVMQLRKTYFLAVFNCVTQTFYILSSFYWHVSIVCKHRAMVLLADSSVCPSVCLSHSGIISKQTFFTNGETTNSSVRDMATPRRKRSHYVLLRRMTTKFGSRIRKM